MVSLESERDGLLADAKERSRREEAYVRWQRRYRMAQLRKQEERLDSLRQLPAALEKRREVLEDDYDARFAAAVGDLDALKTATATAYADDLKTAAVLAKEEIGAITEAHLEVAERMAKVQQDARDFTKKRKELLVKHLDAVIGRLVKAWEAASERIGAASDVGVNLGVARGLSASGAAGALAAGWFFSVFASAASLSSSTYVSYVIAQFAELARGTFGTQTTGADLLVPLAAWAGVLLAAFLLTTILLYAAQWTTDALSPTVERAGLGEALLAEPSAARRRLIRRMARNPDGPLLQWLRAWPQLLVVGGGLIGAALLVSRAPTGGQNPSQIYDTLAAEGIGVLIALAVAGLGTLYVARVMEPRWARLADGTVPRTGGLRAHTEFYVLLACLIVAVGALALSDASSPVGTIGAGAAFVALALLAGLAIAYGHRYRGLYATERTLSRRLALLYSLAEEAAPPDSVDLSVLSHSAFEEDVRAKLGGLLQALDSRSRSTAGGAAAPAAPKGDRVRRTVAWVRREGGRLLRGVGIDSRPGADDSPGESAALLFVSDRDRRFAPSLAFKAEESHRRLRELTDELHDIRRRLRDLDLQQSEEEESIRAAMQTHGEALRQLARRLGGVRKQLSAYRPALFDRYAALLAAVHEGYDIGRALYGAGGGDGAAPPGFRPALPPREPVAPLTDG